MSKRRVMRRGIVLGVVAVLVATGVVVTVVMVSGGLPGRVYELDKACDGTTYSDATPYAGAAPHPVAIFMPSEVGQLSLEYGATAMVNKTAGDPEDPAAMQLVACGTLENERRSGDQVCGYSAPVGQSAAVPMARATYRIRVYELRTHREVRSDVVEGANTECPPAISTNYTPDRFLSELTDVQWQSMLAELVDTGPR